MFEKGKKPIFEFRLTSLLEISQTIHYTPPKALDYVSIFSMCAAYFLWLRYIYDEDVRKMF